MSRTGIRTRIQAIRRDHSRAQLHTVDAEGLEYKLEVPVEAVAGLTAGELVLSWSIEPTAVAGSISSPTLSPTDEFHSLMGRLNTPAPALAPTPTPSARLAQLLGLTITES